MSIEQIKKLAKDAYVTVVANRRHIHAHPELSFCEYATSAFIREQLDHLNISYQVMADTGVVAMITGGLSSSKVIALRADMDALPILESTNTPYQSTSPGIMHACGHDVHTASLLGTASILQSMRQYFGGTVKLIFQPAEEILPGGASLMIKEGALRDPVPDVVIGQHVMPSIPSGKIGFRPGMFMASMDEISMVVSGRGGHGAMPHQNLDPVVIACHIVLGLQQVVSRYNNPIYPTVLTIGRFLAEGAINVTPDKVHLQGTFRTMNEDARNAAHAQMKKMAEGIADAIGAQCEVSIARGYPCLFNKESTTETIRGFAEAYLGSENVLTSEAMTVAEDFAYYSQVSDACFYLLGTGGPNKEWNFPLHSPRFDIDEDALQTSTGLMAYIALQLLSGV